jgi:hypothetical protein
MNIERHPQQSPPKSLDGRVSIGLDNLGLPGTRLRRR